MRIVSDDKKREAHSLIDKALRRYGMSLYEKTKRQKQEFYLKMVRSILDSHETRLKLAAQYKHYQKGFPVEMPSCLLQLAYFIENPDCIYKDEHVMAVIQVVHDIYVEAIGSGRNNAIEYLVHEEEVPQFLRNVARVFYEPKETIH